MKSTLTIGQNQPMKVGQMLPFYKEGIKLRKQSNFSLHHIFLGFCVFVGTFLSFLHQQIIAGSLWSSLSIICFGCRWFILSLPSSETKSESKYVVAAEQSD